ncbi:MAG TPA: hypothetical protein VMT28_18075 [Terriglobales bacterium]|jgi:hypothetical protein|nr:hypothetical protein [Terriglobales bacterium]
MRRAIPVLCWIVLSVLPLAGGDVQAADPWGPWRFLAGEWVGEGGGGPGQGRGGFSFQFDLGEKILVRRNYADYPPTNGKPAYHHHDLTILYPENGAIKADFFDSEGHVIHYTATASPDGKTLMWLSEAAPGTPRYRFTYRKTGADTLSLKFEIAPPEKPEAFATYITASARRTQ